MWRIRRSLLFAVVMTVVVLGAPALGLAQDATPEATPVASPEASPIAVPDASPVADVVNPVASPVVVAPSDEPQAPAQPVVGSFPGPGSIQLVKVAEGLNSPRALAAIPDGSGRMMIAERTGKVRIIDGDGTLLPDPVIDISDRVLSGHVDQGLIGLAVHPQFAENQYFYVAYTDFLGNGDMKIEQFQMLPDNPNAADPYGGRVVMQIERPSTIRNGGTLVFGPDGYLYIASGDGGWAGGTDSFIAQRMDSYLGKVLRVGLTPDSEGGLWYIPEDNPYAGTWGTGEAQAIWIYGLRNPWAFSFDPETGDMFVPDIGEAAWEEINYVPAGTSGQNFGWNLWEGSHCMQADLNRCPDNGVLPIAEYSHEEWGCAVTGIGVYRGPTISFLDGFYLASDYCTGRIWGVAPNAVGEWEIQVLLDTTLLVNAGGTGPDGELYVLSCECTAYDANREVETGGAVWKVVAANEVPEGAETAPVEG